MRLLLKKNMSNCRGFVDIRRTGGIARLWVYIVVIFKVKMVNRNSCSNTFCLPVSPQNIPVSTPQSIPSLPGSFSLHMRSSDRCNDNSRIVLQRLSVIPYCSASRRSVVKLSTYNHDRLQTLALRIRPPRVLPVHGLGWFDQQLSN